MPCLNEERTVATCVDKALKTLLELEIAGEVLVVDNGSTDRRVELARAAGARVIVEPLQGYGNALRRGFDEARGRFIVMADCDDSYDLTDLERFVTRLRAGADLVMGNRLKGEIRPGAMPWHHRWIGNPLLSWFLNLLFRTGVGDSHCGMRGFSKDAYRWMGLQILGMELARETVMKSRWSDSAPKRSPSTSIPTAATADRTCGASATAGGTCVSC
jgi:glycosyltransferase involved in cell wall biosynthesis